MLPNVSAYGGSPLIDYDQINDFHGIQIDGFTDGDGVCLGLSLFWLKLHARGELTSANFKGKMNEVKTRATILNLYNLRGSNAGGSMGGGIIWNNNKGILSKNRLLLPNRILAPAGMAMESIIQVEGYFAPDALADCAPYMTIVFGMGDGAHAVAAAIGHKVDFFDPNYGSASFRQFDGFREWFGRNYVTSAVKSFAIFPCGGKLPLAAGSPAGRVLSPEERRAQLASLMRQTGSPPLLRSALQKGLMPGPPPLLSAKQTQSPPPMLSARPQMQGPPPPLSARPSMQGPPPPLSARPSMQGPPPLLSSLIKAK